MEENGDKGAPEPLPDPSLGAFRRVVLLLSTLDGAYIAPGTRLPYAFGATRYRVSLSRSVGKSSNASSSVPSPYVRCRLGLRNIFGPDDEDAVLGPAAAFDRKDVEDGGRDGTGTGTGDDRPFPVFDEPGKTDVIGVLALRREDDVGIVRRNAAGFDDGVDGRAGGTTYSDERMRPVELLCVLAREAAVAPSYRAALASLGLEADSAAIAWGWLTSMSADNDAFRTSLRCVGDVVGLRPVCDFCPRKGPDFAERDEEGPVSAESSAL